MVPIKNPENAGRQQVRGSALGSDIPKRWVFKRSRNIIEIPSDFTALGRQFDRLCAVALAFLIKELISHVDILTIRRYRIGIQYGHVNIVGD